MLTKKIDTNNVIVKKYGKQYIQSEATAAMVCQTANEEEHSERQR